MPQRVPLRPTRPADGTARRCGRGRSARGRRRPLAGAARTASRAGRAVRARGEPRGVPERERARRPCRRPGPPGATCTAASPCPHPTIVQFEFSATTCHAPRSTLYQPSSGRAGLRAEVVEEPACARRRVVLVVADGRIRDGLEGPVAQVVGPQELAGSGRRRTDGRRASAAPADRSARSRARRPSRGTRRPRRCRALNAGLGGSHAMSPGGDERHRVGAGAVGLWRGPSSAASAPTRTSGGRCEMVGAGSGARHSGPAREPARGRTRRPRTRYSPRRMPRRVPPCATCDLGLHGSGVGRRGPHAAGPVR